MLNGIPAASPIPPEAGTKPVKGNRKPASHTRDFFRDHLRDQAWRRGVAEILRIAATSAGFETSVKPKSSSGGSMAFPCVGGLGCYWPAWGSSTAARWSRCQALSLSSSMRDRTARQKARTDPTHSAEAASRAPARNARRTSLEIACTEKVVGWEAGIRTPIGRSRVCSPTVGRPPSKPYLSTGRFEKTTCIPQVNPGECSSFCTPSGAVRLTKYDCEYRFAAPVLTRGGASLLESTARGARRRETIFRPSLPARVVVDSEAIYLPHGNGAALSCASRVVSFYYCRGFGMPA
jgi:hypothetical protein